MRLLPLLLIPCLLGCGQILSSFKQQKTLTEKRADVTKATLAGAVEITYPESTQFAPTASGNSQISIIVTGHKGIIRAKKHETKTADESHSGSFSIDEWVESTPVWVWPCIIFGMIGLIVAYIIWSKTTVAGRATDHLIAGGIKLVDKQVDHLNDELVHMKPETPEHIAMKKLLDRLKEDRSKMLERQRPEARRRAADVF